jgi:hypothetical protein
VREREKERKKESVCKIERERQALERDRERDRERQRETERDRERERETEKICVPLANQQLLECFVVKWWIDQRQGNSILMGQRKTKQFLLLFLSYFYHQQNVPTIDI